MGAPFYNVSTAPLATLVRNAQHNSDDAEINEIVLRFEALARSLSRSLTNCPHLQQDLQNAARYALVQAVRAHDGREYGFSAYAARYMRGAVLRRYRALSPTEQPAPTDSIVYDKLRSPDVADAVIETSSPWGDGVVAGVIADMKPDQLRIAILRYVEDASLAEIATETETSVPAVSQRLATIRRTVKRALAA